jgi:hypothetical protein
MVSAGEHVLVTFLAWPAHLSPVPWHRLSQPGVVQLGPCGMKHGGDAPQPHSPRRLELSKTSFCVPPTSHFIDTIG